MKIPKVYTSEWLVQIVGMEVDKSKNHGIRTLNEGIYISTYQKTPKLLALLVRLLYLFRIVHLVCEGGKCLRKGGGRRVRHWNRVEEDLKRNIVAGWLKRISKNKEHLNCEV